MNFIHRINFMVLAVFLMSVPAALADTSAPGLAEPDGIFTITPVASKSCIAIKVDLNPVQALAGVRWYNNDDQVPFAKILVASGRDAVPPLYADGVVAAEEVVGHRLGWSEISFAQPFASSTSALYLIFQFPEGVEGVGQAEGPGIGYRGDAGASCVFLSAEGEDWVRFQPSFSLLVEPLLVTRVPGMVALSMSRTPGGNGLGGGTVPRVTRLEQPFPNPCNPTTSISYSLSRPGRVDLRVYDLRGRLVRTLVHDHQERGEYVVQWRGEDDQGSPVASGLYLVRLEAVDKLLTSRVVLLK